MADTLQIDTTLVNAWSNDSRYDYDRELYGGSQNLLEWLSQLVTDWFNEKLGVVADSRATYYILLVVGLLLIALLAWIVWRRRHAVLTRQETAPLDYQTEEDTIYGIDFEGDIALMTAQGNWRQAVRLVYLHTLKQLSDAGRIDWQPSKTPSQYVAEVKQMAFTTMSNHFVRVRYGNFGADETLYDAMRSLQAQVTAQAAGPEKGGGAAV